MWRLTTTNDKHDKRSLTIYLILSGLTPKYMQTICTSRGEPGKQAEVSSECVSVRVYVRARFISVHLRKSHYTAQYDNMLGPAELVPLN